MYEVAEADRLIKTVAAPKLPPAEACEYPPAQEIF